MNNKRISVLLLLLIIVLTTTFMGCSQSSTSEHNNTDVATESDASRLNQTLANQTMVERTTQFEYVGIIVDIPTLYQISSDINSGKTTIYKRSSETNLPLVDTTTKQDSLGNKTTTQTINLELDGVMYIIRFENNYLIAYKELGDRGESNDWENDEEMLKVLFSEYTASAPQAIQTYMEAINKTDTTSETASEPSNNLTAFPITDWRNHGSEFHLNTNIKYVKISVEQEIEAPGNVAISFDTFTPSAKVQFEKEWEQVLDELDVKWISSDESIAIVQDGMIKGLSQGSATIDFIASHPNLGRGKPNSKEFTVQVTNDSVTYMNVAVAETKQITIPSDTAIRSYNSRYESRNDDIATINTQGIVTGVARGEVDIYITSSGSVWVVRILVS